MEETQSTAEVEGETLTRYIPQHPLPEEIRKLAKDDTVCKYCGVSYLIHSEMKALEEKLKTAEKELASLRGLEKREQLLKQENSVLQQQKAELEGRVEANRQLINSLNKELEEKKEALKTAEENGNGYKKKYLSTLKQLSTLSQTVRQQRKDLNDTKQNMLDGKSEIVNCVQSAKEQMVLIKEQFSIEKQELQSKVECLDMEKMVMNESNKKLTESLRAKEEALQKSESELEQQRKNIINLESHMLQGEELKTALDQAEQKMKALQKEVEESSANARTATVELDQYKIQLRAKTTEVNDLSSKLKQTEHNQDLAIQKAQLELKSKEGELTSCLKQLKTLENKWREQQKRESELTQQTQLSQNEIQELRDNYKRAKSDIEALKAERELMIQAHQNRIEDLRESFKNKMAEADNWPQKLQAAVAAEKKRHLTELQNLEDNLKHNFVLELQIEKDKYNELLKKHQEQEKNKNNQRENETAQIEAKFHRQLEEYQRQLTEAKKKSAEREEELQVEIKSLKKIINDLQDRMARLDGEDTGKVADLHSALARKEEDLAEAKNEITTLEGKIREAKEQNQFLQNVVQRECEERFELTEALSEARKELLQLKKPAGGYLSKRGSTASLTNGSQGHVTPPVGQGHDDPLGKLRTQLPPNNIHLSYNNNTSNSRSSSSHSSVNGNDAQLNESRRRIANMMGRPA